MASTITLCRTALGPVDTMRRAGQLAEGAGEYERRRRAPLHSLARLQYDPAAAMVAARRILLSVGLLGLLAAAWRAQWAFQSVKPRAIGGWYLLVATLALFA